MQASNPLFYFQSMKIILGPSDAWWMRQSTEWPGVLYWRFLDTWKIFCFMFKQYISTVEKSELSWDWFKEKFRIYFWVVLLLLYDRAMEGKQMPLAKVLYNIGPGTCTVLPHIVYYLEKIPPLNSFHSKNSVY